MHSRINQNRRAAARRFVALAAAVVLLAQLDAAPARNFIWKATGKQGAVYLVGSVHLLTKDFYPLNPALETAYKNADLLVEEIDLGETLGTDAQMNMLVTGMLPTGQTLDKQLSPASMALVNKRLEGLSLPVEPL